MHTVSIIIPTWNGLSLLQKNLPALLAAEGVGEADLIVADDGSTDGTAQWVQEHVPQAKLVRSEENIGFARICNLALQAATGDAVLLLNNDVRVTGGFLPPLVQTLTSDTNVFAVNGRILLPDGRDEGCKAGRFHNSVFYVDCAPPSECVAPILYATGGAALYRRRSVVALGGFDPIYSPCYWEDVDLSYRAWKRGAQVVYQPASIVYHEHQATTGRLDPRVLARLRARNGFVFQWQNFPVRHVAASLLLGPSVGLYRQVRDRDPSVLAGYRDAVRLWRQILVRRAGERAARTVPDEAVLAQFAPERTVL